jgi:hypothetical protein
MPEETNALIQKIKQAAASGTTEHIVNILKAGLTTTPFCGGIASLMSDYIPSSKFQRLEQFAKKIAEDLNTLQNQVDEAKIQTDEFAFLFENCFRGVAENYQNEKLEAFRGILINSAIGVNLSEDEKEYFFNLVNTLSVLHIRMLKFMAKPIDYLRENNIPTESIRGGFSQFFPIAIPGIASDVIESSFGDLHRYGLISTDKSIFHTMTSGQGIDLLGNRVTPLGANFINFCTTPIE